MLIPKNVGSKKTLSKKRFGPKKSCVQIKFALKEFWIPKTFASKIILSKKIWFQKRGVLNQNKTKCSPKMLTLRNSLYTFQTPSKCLRDNLYSHLRYLKHLPDTIQAPNIDPLDTYYISACWEYPSGSRGCCIFLSNSSLRLRTRS